MDQKINQNNQPSTSTSKIRTTIDIFEEIRRRSKVRQHLHTKIRNELDMPKKTNFTQIDKIFLESQKEHAKIAQLMHEVTPNLEQKKECKKIIEKIEKRRCQLHYWLEAKRR